MGLKAYIPFTQARRRRLYAMSLQKQLKGHQVLLQVEYPDGTEGYRPADWNEDINAWVTPTDERYYSKGVGGTPNVIMGVPIVHVDAQNAGVISAEAAKAAKREENYEYVDADGRELEVVELDDEGEPKAVRYADEGDEGEVIAADGGEIDLHYRMAAPEGYDGEVIDRRLAGYFDPFPVSRQEADQAIEHAITGVMDQAHSMKPLLVGVLLGAGLIIAFIVIMWLLGQIGGGGGGGGVSIGLFLGGWVG